MNRGSASRPPDTIAEGLASMRPRFMNRGSGHRYQSSILAPPRFNEAPIHESGK